MDPNEGEGYVFPPVKVVAVCGILLLVSSVLGLEAGVNVQRPPSAPSTTSVPSTIASLKGLESTGDVTFLTSQGGYHSIAGMSEASNSPTGIGSSGGGMRVPLPTRLGGDAGGSGTGPSGGSSTTTRTITQQSSPYVTMNLVTWESDNGWTLLDSNLYTMSEITIFNALINANGALTYDGNDVNMAQVVPAAHAQGVKVCLGVGGDGTTATVPAYNTVLDSATLRAKLITSVYAQVQQYDFDCIQWDIEPDSPGDVNGTGYVDLLQSWNSERPNIHSDCAYADWMGASTPEGLMAPYCAHMLDVFPSSYALSSLASEASKAGGASKFEVGYDLTPGDDPNVVPTLANLTADRNAGYGVFFFQASLMNQMIYDRIGSAYGQP